jgi:hypothetical protein
VSFTSYISAHADVQGTERKAPLLITVRGHDDSFELADLLAMSPSVVMISIVDAQRDILLNPIGTNVWSGQAIQSLNSAAVTWSLAKELYSIHGPYFAIPLSLFLGMIPTFFQWLIWKVSFCPPIVFNYTHKVHLCSVGRKLVP